MEAATDKGTQTLLGNRLLKVLLVDDEATDRIPVERILRTCSSPAEFTVESVVRLSEAIKNLTEKKYDVVLLDLELPDSSGIEILHQVIKVAPDIPVVVLTERDDELTGFSALEDGATDYLVKDLPLDVVLVRTIIYAIQRKKIQMQSLKLAHDNNERMKELNCLYGISNIVETNGISLEEMLEKTVHIIPAGWQYPDIACARIIFEGKEYKADNFKPSKWTQSADIKFQGQNVGMVEVCYTEERPQFDEGPSHVEKHDLIDAIGERLGKMTERFKAEEKINNSQALLYRIINLLPIRVFWKDKNLRYLGCNELFAKDAGKNNPEDLVGSDDFQTNWKEQAKSYRDDDQSVIKSGKPKLNFEEFQTTPKGDRICLKTSKVPLIDLQGNTIGLLGTYEDITERKRAEEALRESEQKYRELVMLANSIILRWTRDGRITFLNEFGQRFFGYTEAEICGRHVVGTIVPACDSSGRNLPLLMDEICANPVAFEQNINENMRRNGEHVWIAWTNKIVLDSQGQVAEILSIGVDITVSKKAEDTLRESERKMHTIFDQTFQFIGLMTIDGTLIEANRALLKFSDIEASSVLNKPFWLGPWWSHSPQLQEKLRQAVGKAALGEFIRFEATHVAKDGILHYVDFSLKPVKDETGKVIFLIPEGRDITEYKSKKKRNFS